MTEAAKKQLSNLWHTTNIYYHPTIHEYAELMASKLPEKLKVEKKVTENKLKYLQIQSQGRLLLIINVIKSNHLMIGATI